MENSMFEDIRPYYEEEIPAAMGRIASSREFPLLASYVFPERPVEEVAREVMGYTTVREFQLGVMYHANRQILQRSTTGFSVSGIEASSEESRSLSPEKNYLFVSNHRDIMLADAECADRQWLRYLRDYLWRESDAGTTGD